MGCEPSCVFTLTDELPRLVSGSDAEAVARQTRMVDDLLAQAIADGGLVVDPDGDAPRRRVLFHGHCHQKAAGAAAGSVSLLQRVPNSSLEVLDAGCCGMAGSFGFETEHFDLSLAIGGMRLFPAVRSTPADTLIAATGVSCRQQINQGTGRQAQHPVVLLREFVRTSPST